MAKKIKQGYGIKYPFTTDSNSGSLVDINSSIRSKVRSILMHVIFTPKGQKLRDPKFGTDLIKFLFEPNMEETWEKIRTNISDTINEFLPSVIIKNIDILQNEEDPYEAYVKITYEVVNGSEVIADNIIVSV